MDADPLAPVLLVIKLGLYGSALAAAGLSLHASLGIVALGDRHRVLRSAALAGAIALVFATLRLGLANLQLGGANALLDPEILSWTWPALGPSLAAVALGTTALTVGWLLQSGVAAGFGAVALAVSFGLTGHSQALGSASLAPWAVSLHVLIAAFWFAGPVTLWPTSALDDATLIARTTHFSSIAVFVVPLLLALGLWIALSLAGGWTQLVTSLYGQALLTKLGAASFALALGAYNKTVVAKQLRSAPQTGRRTLIQTLGLDALLFLIALIAVAAATSLTGPPSPQVAIWGNSHVARTPCILRPQMARAVGRHSGRVLGGQRPVLHADSH